MDELVYFDLRTAKANKISNVKLEIVVVLESSSYKYIKIYQQHITFK